MNLYLVYAYLIRRDLRFHLFSDAPVSGFWSSHQKEFRHAGHDETFIIYLVASLSLVAVVVYFCRNALFKRLPQWLKPFASEQPPSSCESTANVPAKRWTHWTLLLFFLAFSGFSMSLVPIILTPDQIVRLFEIVPWFAVGLITVADRPTKTPRILFVQYLTILVANISVYSICFINGDIDFSDPSQPIRAISALLALVLICAMPLRNPTWDRSDIGGGKLAPSSDLRSPEDSLSLFRFWTMVWVNPLALLCKKREIIVEDVWQLPYDFQHTRLYMAFREVKGRLLPCLIEANGLDLFISTSFAILEKVLEVTNIRLTSKLYQALDQGQPIFAIYWSAIMLLIDAVRQVSKTTASWYSRKAYERSRGETFIGLFGKLLTRALPGSDATEKGPVVKSQSGDEPESKMRRFVSRIFRRPAKAVPALLSTAQPASNAKVVNLVRGDTYEISQRFWDLQKLISQPIKIIFTMYYLVDIMGWPCTIGFALMAFFLTTNTLLVKYLIKLERQRTAHSDKRAQAVSHFVEASRALKLNGWTMCWRDRILRFRAMEMLKRLQIAYVTATISTLNVTGGVSYPLASIALFTLLLKRGLPNDVIWPSLQLFSQLEASVKETFDLISAFWKTIIPIERVHKYMDEPDRDVASSVTLGAHNISFHDASFCWPSTNVPVLRNLNFEITSGLTIVRGKVGSGKSSLLLAALNEMELECGSFTVPDEPIGYGQQLPWLQSKTIRENIIFQLPFDADRYRQVIHACALAPDFASFAKGDMTKLEEGGVGLSGGQKARVALARAVYSHSRILLLDDPLAPLDHDTATAIVRRFLQGPLANDRMIVMVTHRDDLVLRIADAVIDVDMGTARILTSAEVEEELAHPYHAQSHATHDDTDHSVDHDDELLDSGKPDPEDPTETGSVSWTVYLNYVKAGGWYMWLMLAVAYGISRYCDISRARLLEEWGKDTARGAAVPHEFGYWGLPSAETHPKSWLYVLSALSGGQILSYGVAQVLLARISVNAAQGLFRIAIDKVSHATFRYFDTTPTGQLKNRLIADMGMVDGGILQPLESFVFNLISLIMSLVAVATHQPTLLGLIGIVSLMFVFFFRLYVPVSRCLRRMEMRYLTPIIANIGVMQDGLVTIRAMRVEQHFQRRHLEAVDDFQKQDHFFWSMAFWLDFRLSMTAAVTRTAVVLLMVALGTAASAVGFVLTQVTVAMAAVQQLCERFAQLQLDAVSLERVNMLSRIPPEPEGGDVPPPEWPRPSDDVVFSAMSFRYDDELPAVLDDISLTIPGGATCAVLGRTGSGKSTIANALLATQLPFQGQVLIGGVDLATVNRSALRSRVTFIQQDPTLFPGTLRDNLDPENRFSDEDCARAIRLVFGGGGSSSSCSSDSDSDSDSGSGSKSGSGSSGAWELDTVIDAGGKNLSQGQRQLVGIGRAVLRRSGLVILDEATASIDRATAAAVQRVLRDELARSTVITIAHRLEAVEDADWCLRLDRGRVLECGPKGGSASPKSD